MHFLVVRNNIDWIIQQIKNIFEKRALLIVQNQKAQINCLELTAFILFDSNAVRLDLLPGG